MDRRSFLQTTALGVWAMSEPDEALASGWELRRDGAKEWRAATVPGCWERDGIPGALCGPVWYRTKSPFAKPEGVARSGGGGSVKGERLFWELDAVSYHCEGFADGVKIGEHTGLWDAFAWELPVNARELTLKVEKPGSERFPVKQTLAGFLPYVWGTWGGPWQAVRVRTTGPVRITSVFARGAADGRLHGDVELNVASGAEVVLELRLSTDDGAVVAGRQMGVPQSGKASFDLQVARPELWNPETPHCYTLTLTALVSGVLSDQQARTVGFRKLQVEGERILLNDQPIYFRAPLSWGWYESTMAPNPSLSVFEQELKRVKSLGFNGMKLCLWIPPRVYFELADRLGMLLWVELPLWLPEKSDFFTKQTPQEYARIIRQIGDHPSILLWTLGCEIGEGMDASFLGKLYAELKKQTGSPLIRDNSGSAECYGGPLPEHADYGDFHLYCDLPFARPTFDAFAPRWRERQPFLFGEFNDQDALRDLPAILKRQKTPPWWTLADPQTNPKGVRWEVGVTEQLKTLEGSGLLPRLAELKASSAKQALLARKHTLELTRSYPFTSGYVVTGLTDTPISTAGLFDDLGALRYDPSAFNADTVLFIEPDRRRTWTAGGDRPSWLDRWGVKEGESVRRHVGISHFGKHLGPGALLRWSVSTGQSGELALGPLEPGEVKELGLIEFIAPAQPQKLTLSVELTAAGKTLSKNSWPLWVFVAPRTGGAVSLYDPANLLAGFEEATGWKMIALTQGPLGLGGPGVIIATAWSPELLAFTRNGGRVLYLQPSAFGGLPAAELPFFREAMRLFEDHPSWGNFPHEKSTDFLLYGLASDCAFEPEAMQQVLGVPLTPILTRVDARSSLLHAYVCEAQVGAGRLLLTTLRPYGGLGDQPSGLKRAICGVGLLHAWLEWLIR
ncbi:glycoside hydrolase [Armatimonas sp.]|uniref:glycoside hydrolase n=1 Tax=Armatimonas sp. TaxID=1872638 RepID=UPI003753C15D